MIDIDNKTIEDLEGETWLPIDGYNNMYFISSRGRVKSIKSGKERLKKQQVNQKGYYRVELWNKGKRSTLSVARLVGIAFIPNDDPIHKTTIHHINFDKSLNCVGNLQWLSLQDNIKENYRKKGNTCSSEEHSKKEME